MSDVWFLRKILVCRWMRNLCDDPSLRRRLGAAGRKSMETQYSLQVVAPRVEDLLRSMVKTRCAA